LCSVGSLESSYVAVADGVLHVWGLTSVCVFVTVQKGYTPLHFAYHFFHEDIVDELLRNKADVNSKSSVRFDLMLASMGSHLH